MTHDQLTKTATDVAIGAGATASGAAVWFDWIQHGAAIIAAVGGAALVMVRLAIAIRDWRNDKKDG